MCCSIHTSTTNCCRLGGCLRWYPRPSSYRMALDKSSLPGLQTYAFFQCSQTAVRELCLAFCIRTVFGKSPSLTAPCATLLSIPMVMTMTTKSALGRKGLFGDTSHHCLCRNSKQEQRQELKQRPLRDAACWLVLHD